jgi:serine/threonine-protein kinase
MAKGGMGAVHFGRLLGPEGPGPVVAINRMHPQLVGDPSLASMFLDEARLASRIKHPHVVSLLDVVHSEDELLLVMEYVRGEALSGLLRSHKLMGQPPAARLVAAVVVQALAGLQAAHEACDETGAPLELVHRDFSPQNILVGSDGRARVLDFGVAKARQRLQSTRKGEMKGKPGYVAPEQFEGQATRRTDVYLAGIVLWEALTCQHLFQGRSDAEIFKKAMRPRVEPPSTVRPGLPAAIDAIVMRALAPVPEARFATAKEMAIAIEETGDVASPAEVAEWVLGMAGAALERRDAVIRRIEHGEGPEPILVESQRPSFSPRSSRPRLSYVPAKESSPGGEAVPRSSALPPPRSSATPLPPSAMPPPPSVAPPRPSAMPPRESSPLPRAATVALLIAAVVVAVLGWKMYWDQRNSPEGPSAPDPGSTMRARPLESDHR